MVAELHFEREVLKHALSKHVHHFDYRDGMRARAARSKPRPPSAPEELRPPCSELDVREVVREIYADFPPSPRLWPALLEPRRQPSIKAQPCCSRWARNFQRFMEKHVLLEETPEDEDGHMNDWALAEVATPGPKPSDSPQHSAETSPRATPIFKGTDPQEESWMRWHFLQHMPHYLALILEQKEYREVVSKAQQSQLLSARRQVMASDLAILLRVLPMFNDGDDRNIAEEFALVMANEGRSSRPTRTQLPTVQRRASKLATLPTAAVVTESVTARRASVETMADSIVEAIRLASGKAKGGRAASKGRPNNKGRRQSVGQERSRHSVAQSNLLDARRASSVLGSEAAEDEESLEAVSLEVLLDTVPEATKTRWGNILKVESADLASSKPRFVGKVAHALRQKPQWFPGCLLVVF